LVQLLDSLKNKKQSKMNVKCIVHTLLKLLNFTN